MPLPARGLWRPPAPPVTGAATRPPSGKLPGRVLADFTVGVKQGAPWPADSAPQTKSMAERVTAARSRLWSLQPVRKPALPTVKDSAWVRTPLDRIVLAKLEAKGLKPAPAADRITLLDRVTYDLIGRSPTPKSKDALVTSTSDTAF